MGRKLILPSGISKVPHLEFILVFCDSLGNELAETFRQTFGGWYVVNQEIESFGKDVFNVGLPTGSKKNDSTSDENTRGAGGKVLSASSQTEQGPDLPLGRHHIKFRYRPRPERMYEKTDFRCVFLIFWHHVHTVLLLSSQREANLPVILRASWAAGYAVLIMH